MTDLHILYIVLITYILFVIFAIPVIKLNTKKTFSNWFVLAAALCWPLIFTLGLLALLSAAWGSLYSKLFARKPKP